MKFKFTKYLSILAYASLASIIVGCGTISSKPGDTPLDQKLIISVKDQKAYLLRADVVYRTYVVSTALKGVGEAFNSDMTPRGAHAIADKIGAELPLGAVLVDRLPTGEIMELEVEGRTPITTRILRLRGLESANRNTYDRYIYLHGTPVESQLGQVASGGCVRLSARDIAELFNLADENMQVHIFEENFAESVALLSKRQRELSQVLALASSGDRQSVHAACVNYHSGREGFYFDDKAALRWCAEGARLDVPSSITLLAEIYEAGRGVPQDSNKARQLYERAAKSGHPHALYKAGEMYLSGIGGEQNLRLGNGYLELAVFRGHKGAAQLRKELVGTAQ